MRIFIIAAACAALTGPAAAQSCAEIKVPPTGTGEASGWVIDGQPLCFFYAARGATGQARLVEGANVCFVPDGLEDCTDSYDFATGSAGMRFFVYQKTMRAELEHFTLQLTLW